jgi:hypothetical protein
MRVARGLLATFPHMRFGYGGRVFNINPELRQSMPGIFLGHDAHELVEAVGALLAHGASTSSE